MAHLMLEVLGTLQFAGYGTPIVKFKSDKRRALLAYLAVQADKPHRREKLTGLLWPACPEQSARHNLSQTLFNLRQAIGDHQSKPPFILASREKLQFNPSGDYTPDLHDFNAHPASVAAHLGRRPQPRIAPRVRIAKIVLARLRNNTYF